MGELVMIAEIKRMIQLDEIKPESTVEELLHLLRGGKLKKVYYLSHLAGDGVERIINADSATTDLERHLKELEEHKKLSPALDFQSHWDLFIIKE